VQVFVATSGGNRLLDVCELCSLWLQSSQTSNNLASREAARIQKNLHIGLVRA
jgi:hypothetical protein